MASVQGLSSYRPSSAYTGTVDQLTNIQSGVTNSYTIVMTNDNNAWDHTTEATPDFAWLQMVIAHTPAAGDTVDYGITIHTLGGDVVMAANANGDPVMFPRMYDGGTILWKKYAFKFEWISPTIVSSDLTALRVRFHKWGATTGSVLQYYAQTNGGFTLNVFTGWQAASYTPTVFNNNDNGTVVGAASALAALNDPSSTSYYEISPYTESAAADSEIGGWTADPTKGDYILVEYDPVYGYVNYTNDNGGRPFIYWGNSGGGDYSWFANGDIISAPGTPTQPSDLYHQSILMSDGAFSYGDYFAGLRGGMLLIDNLTTSRTFASASVETLMTSNMGSDGATFRWYYHGITVYTWESQAVTHDLLANDVQSASAVSTPNMYQDGTFPLLAESIQSVSLFWDVKAISRTGAWEPANAQADSSPEIIEYNQYTLVGSFNTPLRVYNTSDKSYVGTVAAYGTDSYRGVIRGDYVISNTGRLIQLNPSNITAGTLVVDLGLSGGFDISHDYNVTDDLLTEAEGNYTGSFTNEGRLHLYDVSGLTRLHTINNPAPSTNAYFGGLAGWARNNTRLIVATAGGIGASKIHVYKTTLGDNDWTNITLDRTINEPNASTDRWAYQRTIETSGDYIALSYWDDTNDVAKIRVTNFVTGTSTNTYIITQHQSTLSTRTHNIIYFDDTWLIIGAPDDGSAPSTADGYIYIFNSTDEWATNLSLHFTESSPNLAGAATGDNYGYYGGGRVGSEIYIPSRDSDTSNFNAYIFTETGGAPALTVVPQVFDNLLADDLTSLTPLTSPALAQQHNILANDISAVAQLSLPSVSSSGSQNDLLANDLTSASHLTSPALVAIANLTAVQVAAQAQTTSPALGQVHGLLATAPTSSSTISSPVFTGYSNLLATSASSNSTLSAAHIGQVHALTATDVQAASESTVPLFTGFSHLLAVSINAPAQVSTSALAQTHSLAANSVQAAAHVSAPSIVATSHLLANGVHASAQVSAPLLEEAVANLLANDVQAVSLLTTPTMVTVRHLTPNSLGVVSLLTTPALGQTHALASTAPQATSGVSGAAIAQVHSLAANSPQAAAQVSTPSSVLDVNLTANSINASAQVSTSAIAQVHSLGASDVKAHSKVQHPDGVAIGQVHALGAQAIQSVGQVSSPAFNRIVHLDAANATSFSQVSQPGAVTIFALNAQSAQSLSNVTAINMAQSHNFGIAGVQARSEYTFTATKGLGLAFKKHAVRLGRPWLNIRI